MINIPHHTLSLVLLIGLLFGYFNLFIYHEKHAAIPPPSISPALPTEVLNMLGHSYFTQLIAEGLFIKTAVFYGGLNKQMNEENLHIMEKHFIAMSQLHPKLLDAYYRSESTLAHRGEPHTLVANEILSRGQQALPDITALPFFKGFNHFHYLNNPIEAGKSLRIASEISGSPKWIGHLASMLMGSGGNIRIGLIWLKAMEGTSQDETVKARYKKEIITFEKAMQVQLALEQYNTREGTYPKELIQLIPVDLDSLPNLGSNFQLNYRTPELLLQRHPSELH